MSQYRVGYKKPPLHSRFVKGRSGNPRGRPKKSILAMMEIFDEEMERKITITEGDKTSRITRERAVYRQLINMALKGDVRATKMIWQIRHKFENLEELMGAPSPVLIINPPEGLQPPAPPIYGEGDER